MPVPPETPGGGAGQPDDPWTRAPAAVARWRPLIEKYAQKFGVDPLFIAAIVWQESRGDPNTVGTYGTRTGKPWLNEIGLMQIMPNPEWNRPSKEWLFVPENNIAWGTEFVKGLLDKTHGDLTKTITLFNGGLVTEPYLSKYRTLKGEAQRIQLNSQGDAVRSWQQFLNSQGFQLAADGIFGPRTEAATKEFQARHGLQADGIVGPATQAQRRALGG